MHPLFRVALGALGMFLVALGLWSRRMNARAAHWPSVKGTVLASELKDRGEDSPDAQIRYSYQIAGVTYESKNISYAGHWSSQDRELVERYPVGASVDVYFDPAKPSRAALEREQSSVWFACMAVGYFFSALAAFYP